MLDFITIIIYASKCFPYYYALDFIIDLTILFL